MRNQIGFKFYVFTSLFRGMAEIMAEEQDFLEFVQLFECVIDNNKKTIQINVIQQNSKLFLKRLELFTRKYGNFKKLWGKFNGLKENEYFMLLPPEYSNIKDNIAIYELENYIKHLNGEPTQEFNELSYEIQNFAKYYNMHIIDINKEHLIYIGESNKNKRVCRFCGKSQPEVTFKNKSHAISESLGNKKIILREECDDCNKFFAKSIEKDFIQYHSIQRTFFNIPTKNNKSPTIKGKNFAIANNGNICISIINDDNTPFVPIIPNFSQSFEFYEKITPQNLYKALCKYALSIIDNEYMQYFSETIKWLKGEKTVDRLPRVVEIRHCDFIKISKLAPLILYIRKGDDTKLPFLIGDFTFIFHKYIFIVPFCSKDSKKFTSQSALKPFLIDIFPMKYDSKYYKFLDFSSNKAKKFQVKLDFKKSKDNK